MNFFIIVLIVAAVFGKTSCAINKKTEDAFRELLDDISEAIANRDAEAADALFTENGVLMAPCLETADTSTERQAVMDRVTEVGLESMEFEIFGEGMASGQVGWVYGDRTVVITGGPTFTDRFLCTFEKVQKGQWKFSAIMANSPVQFQCPSTES